MIDLTTYIVMAITYTLTMHLALSTTREFHFGLYITFFVLGGVLGYHLDSYITGFVFAMVMHLIFWGKGSD